MRISLFVLVCETFLMFGSSLLGQSSVPGMGGSSGLGGAVAEGLLSQSPVRSSLPSYANGGLWLGNYSDFSDACWQLAREIHGPSASDDDLYVYLGECGCQRCGGGDGTGPTPECPCEKEEDIPRLSVETGGDSGCASCGGGGAAGGSGINCTLDASSLERIWVPNNRSNHSSFSPGFYSQFDSQLDISVAGGGTTIQLFDVRSKKVVTFVDGLNGDTLDGQFRDIAGRTAVGLSFVNSSNVVVSDPELASKAILKRNSSNEEHFEIVDFDPSPTAVELSGRLVRRQDRDGHFLQVSYKSWTPTELSQSPERQWQIDKVSDFRGNELTFQYHAAQHSGRWCVSNVSRNSGGQSSYTYADGKLATVTRTDGSQSSFTYGQDATSQTATVSFHSFAENRTVKYFLTNDYMSLSTGDAQNVINQPTGIVRMIKNNSNEVEWLSLPATNPAVNKSFQYVGGNAAYVSYGDGGRQMYQNWSVSTPSSSDEFPGISGTLDPVEFAIPGGATPGQLYQGLLPGYAMSYGAQVFFQYDSNGAIIRIDYSGDGSFETFTRNSLRQVTRHRHRNGDVEAFNFDSAGRLLVKQTGLKEVNGTDVATDAFAEWKYDYYPTGHTNAGMLKAEKNPLFSGANSTLHIKGYSYDSLQRLTSIIDSANVAGSQRPTTLFAYDSSGNLSQVTSPEGHVTSYTYDSLGRRISTTHPDGSTDQVLFGSQQTASAGRILKQKDRSNVVTSFEYDAAGRMTKTIVGDAIDPNILDSTPSDTPISDVNLRQVMEYSYLPGSMELRTVTLANGAKVENGYDFKNRLVESKSFPKTGSTLVSRKAYLNNQLFYDEDPYGRRKYYGYRASDGTLIRTITCTTPEQTFADFTAVWNQVRSSSANATFVIHDAIRDESGRLTQIIDGRGIETRMEYDAAGRETNKRTAYGTALEARTETLYDAAGHVIEVRTPRYFDSTDTNGSNKAREQWTYNGRGLVATHTVSPGTADAATESYTYDLGGHQATRTDFGGNVWTRYEDSCCDKKTANADPLGHGSIVNTDSMKRTVHMIQVSDVSTYVGNFSNPTDAKTLSETTTKYDAAGRVTHQTTWLAPRGLVDPANPPIAGLNGVSASDGLTTQYFYDNNLADGVGLDSAGGVSALKLGTGGSGSFSVSLSAAIAKLASTPASGGASVSFSATAPGRATVTVSPEDEISFSISDAAGRSVMSGKLNNYRGSGATALNTLATWSCTQHDSTDTLSGYGTVLVLKNIDPLGSTTQSWTDGAGRTLKSIDQAGNATVMTYDAGGNQLSVRDANSVGADMLYDELGRNTQRTDTAGAVTKTEYDKSGNAIKQTDAKNKHTFISFDSRNRRKSTTDRISAATNFAYTALGQLAYLTDAESQTTSYTYDSRGSKLTETYPDHTPSTSPGQTGYGIVTFTYDNAGRVLRKQDQLGDTCTYNYDLAGRMTSRNYRTLANSPSGTIADTDTFTFDKAGRMLTAVNGRYTNTVTYAYDPVGRKASESLTISGQTYTIGTEYNSRGEMIKQTYPDGSISDRTYHATGALNELKLDSSTVSTRTYDAGRRLTSDVLGNGITETRTYSNDNLLTAINYSNTSLGDLTYTWDTNKNKTSESISGTMSGYGFTQSGTVYDDEDRLTGFARANSSLTQSWSLTSVGDWSSVTTNGTAQSRTHGPTHELLTAGGQTVNTDVKGNITLLPAALASGLSPQASSLLWDFDNKLKSVDVGNDSSTDVEYKYDALGRRVARVGSSGSYVYVQSDQQTIADYGVGDAPSSPLYRYVYASYIDEPVVRKGAGTGGTIHYYHRNQQYSITAVTTSAGAIAERYAYSAYGEPTICDASGSVIGSSSINNRYSYTGREWDETVGLYHFRARWLSPKTGRFLGRDPIKYLGGVNLFSFMRTRLLDSADPLGLKSADHHLFPKAPSIRPRIESLCKGFNVDDWTVPVDAGPNGHGNIGTEHWQWHHGCGKYIDKVNEILGKSRNCCDFLTDMIELINNTNQCVARLMGSSTMPPIKTKDYISKNPTNWDPNGLLDQFCDPPCSNAPIPSNPYIDVIPWWVPDKVENDIYQDVGVVVACVVVGVVAGEVIFACCPAAAAAPVAGGAEGAVGHCVIRKVAIELAEELPLVLAP